jgi:homoserine kinase type II
MAADLITPKTRDATFPVIQSVVDPAALGRALAARYTLTPPVRCRLVSRGINDLYWIAAGPRVFAAKVAAPRRGDAEFAYEPAFVAHLDRVGFAVPTPASTWDGAPFFTIEAPEGRRQVMLLRWLDGSLLGKAVSEEQARQLGAWLARIHQAAAGFVPKVRRRAWGIDQLQTNLPQLMDMIGGDAGLRAFLGRATSTVLSRLAALDPQICPRGACHGDYHYGNIMVMADRAIAVLHFSDCGDDFMAADLASFFWRADCDGAGDQLNPAFQAGYEAVRPLQPAERANMPLFRAARHLAVAAAYAAHTNRIGPVAGFDGNLRYYLSMIRLFCAQAEIA